MAPTPAPTPVTKQDYKVTMGVSFASMTAADFTPKVKTAFIEAIGYWGKLCGPLSENPDKNAKCGSWVGITSVSRRAATVVFEIQSQVTVTSEMSTSLSTYCTSTSATGLTATFTSRAAANGVTITPGAVTVTQAPVATGGSSGSSGGSNVGMIVGVVIGVLVFVGLAGGGAYWYFVLRAKEPEKVDKKARKNTPRDTVTAVGLEMEPLTPRDGEVKKKKKKKKDVDPTQV